MRSQTKRPRSSHADEFMAACWEGRLKDIEKLFKGGVDVNLRHSKPLMFAPKPQDAHLTGLMYAAIQGHTDVAHFLMSHGADVLIESKLHNTALAYAAPLGRKKIVEELLSRGADPDDTITAGFGVFSVLHQACHNGHVETARALISHGADVRAVKFGNPLQAAAEVGCLEIVRELLMAGANADPSTMKPLIAAAARGHDLIVKELLSAGANPDATDTWGMTALMWAARNGRASTVKLLIAQGANLHAVAGNLSYGKLTALEFAEKEHHAEVVRILRSGGAKPRVEAPKAYEVRVRRGGEWVT